MANRFFVSGGNGNYNSTSNWSSTSGGATGSTVPTSADDVFLNAASGANTLTINVSSACLTLTCTGFIGTLAGSSNITVAGNVTFVAGMTITATGILSINATSTITTGGKTWGGAVNLNGNGRTYTLGDNFNITGTLTTSNTNTFNGFKYIVSSGLTINTINAGSTSNFDLVGTGTWSIANDNGNATYTINTSGTITLGTTITFATGTKTINYTTGTVITTGNTTNVSGTVTLNTNGISWNNLLFQGTSTITISSTLTNTGTLTIGSLGQVTTVNGGTLQCNGNFTKAGTSSTVVGTANIVLGGTGNWTDTTTIAGGYLALSITINTAGVITCVGTAHRYRTGTITYTSGTVIAGTSQLLIEAATTLNTNGMVWNSLTFSNTSIITNNSLLTAASISYAAGSVITFAGTSPWTTNNFYILTSNNVNHTLLANQEYKVNTYFESIATTSSLKDSLVSSIPGTKALFTLAYDATQNVGYTNAVDIDSSRGQTIWTFNGVVTRTLNWNVFTSNNGNQRNYIF